MQTSIFLGGMGYYNLATWNDTLDGSCVHVYSMAGTAVSFYFCRPGVGCIVSDDPWKVSYVQFLGSRDLSVNGTVCGSGGCCTM